MARTRFLIVALLVSGLAILLSLACDDLVTETIQTTIAGHPTAEFKLQSGYNDSGCVPFEVGFDDQSSGPIDKWTWYFGDGDSVVNDTNPIHIYDSAGVYACTLKVEDTATEGVDTEVKSRFIVVGTTVADFASTDTLSCAERPVHFQASGLGGVTSLFWEFGDDGTKNVTSALDSPVVHTYVDPGLYTVTLTATGDCGQKEITKSNYVRIVECPGAIISLDTNRGCVPFKVHFNDTLSTVPDGEIIGTRAWYFSNGHTSNKAVDSTTFATADTIVVRLAVLASNGGTDTAYDTIISVAATEAVFTTLTPTVGCLIPNRQFQVKFQSQSIGEIDRLLWEFGDGDTAWDEPAPVHAYDEGFYTVRLTAYGECSNATTSQMDLVRVSASLEPPASFIIWDNTNSMIVAEDVIETDTANIFTFIETSAPSGVKSILWHFSWLTTAMSGDSIDYKFNDTAGTYTVSMDIFNDCDTLTTAERSITIVRPTVPPE